MQSMIIQNNEVMTFKCRGQEDAYKKAAKYCDVDKPFAQYLLTKGDEWKYIGGKETDKALDVSYFNPRLKNTYSLIRNKLVNGKAQYKMFLSRLLLDAQTDINSGYVVSASKSYNFMVLHKCYVELTATLHDEYMLDLSLSLIIPFKSYTGHDVKITRNNMALTSVNFDDGIDFSREAGRVLTSLENVLNNKISKTSDDETIAEDAWIQGLLFN